MAILDIITVPHPVLKQRARPLRPDEFGPALAQRLSDMAETMYAAPGVGLAAPQVGDSLRYVVIDPSEGDERGRGLTKMVNPVIEERTRENQIYGETCLSVPGLEVDVKRSLGVRVSWQDPLDGARQEAWFEGYDAIVIQHELDHLEGEVILNKVSAFRRSRYLKRLLQER
ncbi:MAG: peptide deformylase [Deltaproteobacteria bacterium]|nr:peptide deformylase [Deltaproteobacteria bacterium]